VEIRQKEKKLVPGVPLLEKPPMPDPARWEPIKRFVKFPIERVHIELTNRCNFNCAFCPSRYMTRPKGSMDKKLAKKLLDEIATEQIAEKVVFHIMGEPTLYRELEEVLNHARSLNLTTTLSSNGSRLDEKMADMLGDAGLAKINISLQTPDETSWKLRGFPGMSFDEYADRIIRFAGRIMEKRSDMEVRLLVLVTGARWWARPFQGGMKINVVDTDRDLRAVLSQWTNKLYDLAEKFGDTRGSRVKALAGIEKVDAGAWHILHVHPNFAMETYILESWGNALAKGKVYPSNFGYCSGLSDHMGVLADGRYVYCCRDFDGRTSGGNANDMSIVDFFNTPEVLKAVKGFKNYRVVNDYCKVCMGSHSRAAKVAKQIGSIFLVDLLRSRFYKELYLYK